MFGKRLGRELIGYVRRLWPFAIGVVVTSVLACVIVLTDTNPVESIGLITGIAFFAIAALAFVLRGLAHAYVTFHKSLSAELDENKPSVTRLLWAQIFAFMIFVAFTALFFLAGITAFSWEAVGQMFSAFDTEWLYFVEFVLYLIITAFTVYVIPTTWIAVFRFGKQKKWRRTLSLVVGIIALCTCFGLIVMEVLLLNHAPSTDMPLLWATIVIFLAIFILVDIGMFLLTRYTLKSAFTRSKPIDP